MAAATNNLSWVDDLGQKDVISMCNVRENIVSYYFYQGRSPNFPKVATPEFNPDQDGHFQEHDQPLEPNAQDARS
eukprot:2653936-Amphidinium_carterae.1